MQLSIAIAKNL